MKVLVTGSEGQVGNSLSAALAKSPFEYTLLSHNDLDITDAEQVFNFVSQQAPDIIVNAAAFTSVEEAETQRELAYAVNKFGAGFLASAANTINTPIIHLSTDYVFSGNSDHPYRESDHTEPLNTYGRTKLEGEAEIIKHNAKHIILRTSWIFSKYGHNFFKTMQRLALNNSEVIVVNDQFGGPTYAGDIANAILIIINHFQKTGQLDWGIYHYCGYPYTSWFGFAEEIFNRSIKEFPSLKVTSINTADYPTKAKRPYNSRLDCTKINTLFGIEPSNWQNAINNLVNTSNESD